MRRPYRYRSELERWLATPINGHRPTVTTGEIVIPLAILIFLAPLVILPWLVVPLVGGGIGLYVWWLVGQWRHKAEFERRHAWRKAHPEVTDKMVKDHAPWWTGEAW